MSAPLDALRAIIEGLVGSRLDRLALYPARVVAQSADLTRLDLQPDDSRIPPCAGVPIRHGIPGVTVTVASGSRVLLGYAAGDPMQPYAALWEAGSVTLVSVNGGAVKVARDGESVVSSSGMAMWITAVSALLNAPGAVIGAPGSVTPPAGAIGAVSGGSSVFKVP